MNKILLISVAGMAGTLARYWLSGAVYSFLGRDFPWGTWSVNVLGCFLFGLVWTISEDRGLISTQARIIILVGFMGAFTTFSTLIFESYQLVRDAEWVKIWLNLIGQNTVGFAAVYLGVVLGRFF
jgi:CrcB protein